jgi:hypothetical protein
MGGQYPRFDPDAELLVDAHNGPEQWTGRDWNDYVDAAVRDSTMVTARLLACPEPVTAVAFVLPGGESTAAALRRAEQERDAALAEVSGVRASLAELADEVEDLKATLAMRTGQLMASRRHVQHADAERDLAPRRVGVMTGPDHYLEAERLLRQAALDQEMEAADRDRFIAAAQAHATLALAAATAVVADDEAEWKTVISDA